MEEITTNGTVITIVAGAIVSGIGWLVKNYFADRNKQRDEIKSSINQMSKDLDNFQAIILDCEHQDCQTKKVLAEYLKNRQKSNTTIL